MNKIRNIRKIVKPIEPWVEKLYSFLVKTSLRRYMPTNMIFIETTSSCNLRCPGCYRTSHKYVGKNKNMSLKDFKRYVDQLPSTISLILHGLGEPTINPDFPEMVKYAHDSRKFNKISFTTNTMAKPPEIYEILFANGLSNIRISVDTLNQEEVEKLRPGTNVKTLAENIKYLHQRFADKISICMVASNVNLNSVEETVRKLVNLGVKTIKLQTFQDEGDSDKCLSEEEKEKYVQIVKRMKYEGVKIKFLDPDYKIPNVPCNAPSTRPVITVDGYLTPCSRIHNKDIFNFGSLKEESFKELFFSRRVDKMRNKMKMGKYPAFCKGCYSNHSERKD